MGWGYPKYVSVGEKRAKAEKKLKQLQKKNPNIEPVVIEGTAIAKKWWGKSWNKNLERYADYSNRIGRGRSYVRYRAVLDLKIMPGIVKAMVQGSTSTPYDVSIKIKPIPKETWQQITNACEDKIDSLQEFLMGKFPKKLSDIFMAKYKGLFPSPDHISFSCSCPDSASMCKHVAATLYGVGARLDENPALFFKLRSVNVDDLIAEAVQKKTNTFIEKAKKKSTKIIDDANLSDMFDIDLDGDLSLASPKPKSTRYSIKKTVKKKITKSTKKKTTDPKRPSKILKKKIKSSTKTINNSDQPKKLVKSTQPSDVMTVLDVAKMIRRSRKGVNIPTLKKKTGFSQSKLYSMIYKLKKEGKIQNISRGVYIGK